MINKSSEFGLSKLPIASVEPTGSYLLYLALYSSKPWSQWSFSAWALINRFSILYLNELTNLIIFEQTDETYFFLPSQEIFKILRFSFYSQFQKACLGCFLLF